MRDLKIFHALVFNATCGFEQKPINLSNIKFSKGKILSLKNSNFTITYRNDNYLHLQLYKNYTISKFKKAFTYMDEGIWGKLISFLHKSPTKSRLKNM